MEKITRITKENNHAEGKRETSGSSTPTNGINNTYDSISSLTLDQWINWLKENGNDPNWANALTEDDRQKAIHTLKPKIKDEPTPEEPSKATSGQKRSIPPVLPPEFWQKRPYLQHIQQAAFSSTASPDAYLGCVLARSAASISHGYIIPDLIATTSGLQIYTALIGPSGTGKSTSFSKTGKLVSWSTSDNKYPFEISASTGEGLTEAYLEMRPPPKQEGEKEGKAVKQQVRHNVLAYVDEADAMNKRNARNSGNTLWPTLRTMFSGRKIGEHNASEDHRRNLDEHTYSLGLVIGFQTSVIGPLLADAGTGTPQRFLCLSTQHPGLPDNEPVWPGPLPTPTIPPNEYKSHARFAHDPSQYGYAFSYTPEITQEIKAQQRANISGETEVEEMASQRNLLKLKIAAHLAYFDNRLSVTNDDWDLAEEIVSTSDKVREWAQKQVYKISQQQNEASAKKQGEREMIIDRQKTHDAAKRIATLVWNNPDGVSRIFVKDKMSKGQRKYFKTGLAYAMELKWLKTTEEGELLMPGEVKP